MKMQLFFNAPSEDEQTSMKSDVTSSERFDQQKLRQ
jgi:hypothetical protein